MVVEFRYKKTMSRWSHLTLSCLVVACQTAHSQPSDAHGGAAAATAPASRPDMPVFTGACDASGAVALSDRLFAVGDDEDNVLRVYDAQRGGAPVFAVDLSPELDLKQKKKKKKKKKAPETDIEAATRVGDLAFWLTSHGRNSKGKVKAERFRFFATTTAQRPSQLRLVGSSYHRLLEDLLADPRFAPFGLAGAAERAPKEEGGLNIEGMTGRDEGGVWIGFRSPVPGGKALLVPLLNPERVIQGEPARFGDPLLLDLGGLGVRGMSRWHGRYLIIAGHYAGAVPSQLYTWDGKNAAQRVHISFEDFNPEGFFSPPSADRLLLLSDDGAREVDGKECKRLRDPDAKRFRGRWLTL